MAADVVDILTRCGADADAVEGTAAYQLAQARQAFEDLLTMAHNCVIGAVALSDLRDLVHDHRAAQHATERRQRRIG